MSSVLTKYAPMLLKGLVQNFRLTLMGAILPLLIGIPLMLLASKKRTCATIFRWVSLPFECLCFPFLAAFLFYYMGSQASSAPDPFSIAVWALTLCHLAYLPARYNPSFSLLKNVLYYGLGLLSALFRWSTFSFLIGIFESLAAARNVFAISYSPYGYFLLLIASFLFLLMLELGRRIILQCMKSVPAAQPAQNHNSQSAP